MGFSIENPFIQANKIIICEDEVQIFQHLSQEKTLLYIILEVGMINIP